MENYLNIIHFCFYKAHCKLHLFAKKINPFSLIHKFPFQKRRYRELGINIEEKIDIAFGDNIFGLSTTVAGGALWGGIALLFISLLILLNVDISFLYVILCAFISAIISYIFVFKDDKYIKYFRKYGKWSRKEKEGYAIMTTFVSVVVLFIFLLVIKT